MQIETLEGLHNLEAIAQTDGLGGVFIGPSDLSASMGRRGQVTHPDVDKATTDTISRLVDMDVPAGVMALDPVVAKSYLACEASFVAVAEDLVMQAEAVAEIRNRIL